MLIHAVGFFIQHTKDDSQKELTTLLISSNVHSQKMIPEIILKKEQKPEIKIRIRKPAPLPITQSHVQDSISPSGEIIP